MTAKKYNEKIEKLVWDMVHGKKTKKELKEQREAWEQLRGLWKDNPRTEEDLKRARQRIWGSN